MAELTLLNAIRRLKVSEAIASGDMMYNEESPRHYFYVGRSDLLTIYNAVNIRASYAGGDTPVENVLDFGCGHGRVTRWLRAGFPTADICVTDFDQTGVGWCVDQFGCHDVQGMIAPDTYDLIWLGSVFTHLPTQVVEPLLQKLLQSLKKNGLLAITSQGRFAAKRLMTFDWDKDSRTWMHYNLSRENAELLLDQYQRLGYGYVNYPHQKGYGVCIADPSWYSSRVTASSDYLHILFQEKGSDNHQDVNVYMRSDLLDDAKGPLW